MPRIEKTANPFPGLRPFREEEEHLFFGRESQIDRMIDKLAPSRFLAIVGASGSGKSSLVNCGLRPALRRGLMSQAGTSWRIAQFRPGNKPIRALAQALSVPGLLFPESIAAATVLDDIVDATLRMSALGLTDLYQQAFPASDVNLLVIVDQFEELFRYRAADATASNNFAPSEEAVAFVRLLLEAREQTEHFLPIYIAITMRSDFFGDCAQFEGLPEAINDGQYLVPRMSRAERRMAIDGPIAVGGGTISPALLMRLVNDVGDNPDQLSILQHALNRTWARCAVDEEAAGELRLNHYEDIGMMASALDRHAEKAYGKLKSAREQALCERIFRALTDRGTDARGIRRPTKLAALCRITGATQAEVLAVLDVFRKPSRSFLMPPMSEPLDSDTIVDISHESLMRVWQRLKRWAETETRSVRSLRRLAETSALYAAGSVELLAGRELETQLAWWNEQQPTKEWAEQYQEGWEQTSAFLDASRRAHRRELADAELKRHWNHTWLRAIRLVFSICALLLLVFLIKDVLDTAQSKAIAKALHNREPAVVGQQVDRLRTSLVQFDDVLAVFDGKGPFFVMLAELTIPPALLFLLYIWVAHGGERLYCRANLQDVLDALPDIGIPPPLPPPDPAALAHSEYAGWWPRVGAYALDAWICSLLWFGTLVAAFGLQAGLSSKLSDNFWGFSGMGAGLLMSWLLQAILTSSKWQATLGMKAARIIVTGLRGERISFGRALLRRCAALLSYIGLIGYLIQPWTRRRQALHDLVSGTVVLKQPPPKLVVTWSQIPRA